jgi:hypothetical protein
MTSATGRTESMRPATCPLNASPALRSPSKYTALWSTIAIMALRSVSNS